MMMLSLEGKSLFRPKEVAIRLFGDFRDANRRRIYRWIHEKKIKTIKDSNKYFIPKKLFRVNIEEICRG